MSFEQYALATFVLIGLVNGIQFAINKEWNRFVLWIVAVIAGTLFGFLRWFGLPGIEMGLAVGINSSGVYKVGQVIGGLKKTTLGQA